MFLTNLSLRMKFITGLVLFALALGGCISVILYFHFNSIMESQISQRSRMLLAQSNAVQDYVKTVLRPEMFDTLPKGRFVLKAMSSSYISREVMARLNTEDDQTYHYRRVSKKPRNLKSTPNEFETSLITRFDKNKQLTIWEDDTMVGDVEYHIVARPVIFKDSCMHCHGIPQDAPVELLEIYGDKNGFHYTPGEVGGVVVAGFPVDMIKGPAKAVTSQYLTFYLIGIILFAALISLFFDRLVMKNLQNLTTIFKTQFSGEQELQIIEKLKEKDEIEGLIEGVEELAVCLCDARNELEGYARNLEKKVTDRTKEINDKAKKHQADVSLFVGILSRFGGSLDTKHLISGTLESIGERFDAYKVIYHCSVVSEKSYEWYGDKANAKNAKKVANVTKSTKLSDEIKQIIWTDEVLSIDNTLYLPVKSQESHWGILSISWLEPPNLKELNPAILLGLGQQIAILIENIQAFSNVRFQNDMLQSVFEGISDPLLLIDTDCHILMANKGSNDILLKKGKTGREKELKKFLSLTSAGNTENCIIDQMSVNIEPVSREVHTIDNRSFRVDLYPLPKREQADLRIVLYAREITMEKQMMFRMQQAERLSSVGKIAAGVAHEINNPLGVISCYTDLIKDAVHEKETIDDINVIEKHTKKVQKVVQELLKLSRPKTVITGVCNINKIIIDAVKVFEAQSASKQIKIKTSLASGLPDIKCDAAILEQILTNIWINAFDALQEKGGEVKITTSKTQESKEVLLTIYDNGPGIPDHILNNIFDPFFTTKDIGKGTGLGLAVVYGFINELGGHIEVKSDKITSFKIYFPVKRS